MSDRIAIGSGGIGAGDRMQKRGDAKLPEQECTTEKQHAFSKGVLLATPVNLWAVLKTVAFTWQQDVLTEDAKLLSGFLPIGIHPGGGQCEGDQLRPLVLHLEGAAGEGRGDRRGREHGGEAGSQQAQAEQAARARAARCSATRPPIE